MAFLLAVYNNLREDPRNFRDRVDQTVYLSDAEIVKRYRLTRHMIQALSAAFQQSQYGKLTNRSHAISARVEVSVFAVHLYSKASCFCNIYSHTIKKTLQNVLAQPTDACFDQLFADEWRHFLFLWPTHLDIRSLPRSTLRGVLAMRGFFVCWKTTVVFIQCRTFTNVAVIINNIMCEVVAGCRGSIFQAPQATILMSTEMCIYKPLFIALKRIFL